MRGTSRESRYNTHHNRNVDSMLGPGFANRTMDRSHGKSLKLAGMNTL